MAKRKLSEIIKNSGKIAEFVKIHRNQLGYTQSQFAERTGVGLRFLKELETGKQSVQLDKVNQVLRYFGYELAPVQTPRESPYD